MLFLYALLFHLTPRNNEASFTLRRVSTFFVLGFLHSEAAQENRLFFLTIVH